MKIGNYTDDEILEFMTEGEGRGFLGRSMFDAMYFEIERLNKRNKEIYEGFMATTKELTEYAEEVERLNNIINEAIEFINGGKGWKKYKYTYQEQKLLEILQGSDSNERN